MRDHDLARGLASTVIVRDHERGDIVVPPARSGQLAVQQQKKRILRERWSSRRLPVWMCSRARETRVRTARPGDEHAGPTKDPSPPGDRDDAGLVSVKAEGLLDTSTRG